MILKKLNISIPLVCLGFCFEYMKRRKRHVHMTLSDPGTACRPIKLKVKCLFMP
jgi:hypothetical protein